MSIETSRWKNTEPELLEYDLDFSRIIERDQKQLKVYRRKLEYVEWAIRKRVINQVLHKIMKDPTMFIYWASGLSIKPRWYQDMVLSDPYPYVIYLASNQSGKSFSMNMMGLHDLAYPRGYQWNSVIISASKGSQAKYQMDRIKQMKGRLKINIQTDEDNAFNLTRSIKKGGKVAYHNSLLLAPYTVGALGYAVNGLYCVTGDTKIMTKQYGYLPIKRIVEERMKVDVMSYNHAQDELEWKPVTNWSKTDIGDRDIITIEQGRDKLRCTNDHKIYTQLGYSTADKLKKIHKLYKLKEYNAVYEKKINNFDERQKVQRSTTSTNLWERFRRWLSLQKETGTERKPSFHTFRNPRELFQLEKEYNAPFRSQNTQRQELVWRRDDIKVYDVQTSYIDRIIRHGKTKFNRTVSKKDKTVGTSGMVYGRRKFISETMECNFIYSRFQPERKQAIKEMVRDQFWDNQFDCERQKKRFVLSELAFERAKDIMGTDRTLHTREPYIQNKKDGMFRVWQGILSPRTRLLLYERMSDTFQEKVSERIYEKEKSRKEEKYVYDITVQDNHNYFANNILVHNCDEVDFWETDTTHAYNQYLQPRTYETMKEGRARIRMFSNPNGVGSFLHDLVGQRLEDGSRKYHVYRFNYWDTPGANKEDFQVKSIGLTRAQVESTLLGIFSSSELSYFSHDEIVNSYDSDLEKVKLTCGVGRQTYWFLDVGSTHDQSVLVGCYTEPDRDNDVLVHVYLFFIKAYPVGYPIARVVGSVSHTTDDDGWHHERSVRDILSEYSDGNVIPVLGCDVTGNSGISPLFDATGLVVEDVTFSGPAKSGMFQRFKYFMEKGLLHRVRDKTWESQARWLMAVRSTRGYLMIHNVNHFKKKGRFKNVKSEEDRDDMMDATAGVISLADNYVKIKPSLKIFKRSFPG